MHRMYIAAAVVVAVAFTGFSHAETYKIDSVHSVFLFRVKHQDSALFYGRFNNPAGIFTIDPSEPGKASFIVEVQAENVDTGNQKRDQHLRSPDFFNAKEFPTITFKSNSVKPAQGRDLEVNGELTLLGQIRPVTVTLEHVGDARGQRGKRSGYHGIFTIKRSDFGMTFMPDALGDEVQITVSFVGVAQ
jgi:polyisoprenoid-binding protein YceI